MVSDYQVFQFDLNAYTIKLIKQCLDKVSEILNWAEDVKAKFSHIICEWPLHES